MNVRVRTSVHGSAVLFAAIVFASSETFAQVAPARDGAVPSLPSFVGARVVSRFGEVTVASAPTAPDAHRAQVGETLGEGANVRVSERSAALLAFANGVTLTLMPGSELTLNGANSGRRESADMPGALAPTLVRGAARVISVARPIGVFSLVTRTATVDVGRGDGVIATTADGSVTRISVHRGEMRAKDSTGEHVVRAGDGVREQPSRRSSVHHLLRAPRWDRRPPAHATTVHGPTDLQGDYYVTGRRRATSWRIEVARDPDFTELTSVEVVDGSQTRWSTRQLMLGTWFVRMSALDRDRFESAPSAPSRIEIHGPEIVPGSAPSDGQAGRLAAVRVPPGVVCSVDDGPSVESDHSIRLSPAREHRVRCIPQDNASSPHELVVPAAEAGPVLHTVTVSATSWNEGVLTVRLADAEGYAIPYADVAVNAGPSVAVDPLREDARRGVYRAAIYWRGGEPPRLHLHFTINGRVSFDEEITPTR
jgi:hypothetical protein